ncbi:hypothetical protein CHLRE_08g362400v5 [Chlamydomonas reinhardtii]|uniref:Uncharacterized protein n=1 Tax=Chlamydomonas reinhardtii TaxID=3055 RepID=A0A2K3DGJ9_CHLRE|nr:uncharacterized protein CHLRE_08g362400v5 [Chlamydomonas reinhardtii]PNW79673.1 hypothetical protein CHLRE_08g362400v5 [Chlamydomonas reinhardtii]
MPRTLVIPVAALQGRVEARPGGAGKGTVVRPATVTGVIKAGSSSSIVVPVAALQGAGARPGAGRPEAAGGGKASNGAAAVAPTVAAAAKRSQATAGPQASAAGAAVQAPPRAVAVAPPVGPEAMAVAQGGSGSGGGAGSGGGVESGGGAADATPGSTSPGSRGAARLAAGALKAAAASSAAAAEDAAKAAAVRPRAAALTSHVASQAAGAAALRGEAAHVAMAATATAPERPTRPRVSRAGAGSPTVRPAVDVRALLGDDNDEAAGLLLEPAQQAVASSNGDPCPTVAEQLPTTDAHGNYLPASFQEPALPEAGVYVVADPYGEELIAMLQHCGCCTRIGLAVQAHGGRPALVSVYAPPALMQVEGPEGHLVQWPAAVYLVDPLAAAASYGGGADGDFAAAALLCSLQPLLESTSISKMIYGGGGALACLEEAIRASSGDGSRAMCSQDVQDIRIVLTSLQDMLGVPHTPPLQAAQTAGPDSSVAWLRGLHAHVARLRDALAGTGLWADRPQLLAALTARHFAALREDAQAALGAAGGNEDAAARALTRPLGPSQLEVAARAARHLPELWAALVQEAVPWVAVHASAAALMLSRHRIAAAAT